LPDGNGAFFGTTSQGGAACSCETVFKLSPPTGGQTTWTKRVIYSFQSSSDGDGPYGPLAVDASGALYGVTAAGGGPSDNGGAGWGTVYKLTPPTSGGAWTKTMLHSFQSDGGTPLSGFVLDNAGAIYGTTQLGGHRMKNPNGAEGFGSIFKITQYQGNGRVLSLTPNLGQTPSPSAPDRRSAGAAGG
jgi:hypothetical protein